MIHLVRPSQTGSQLFNMCLVAQLTNDSLLNGPCAQKEDGLLSKSRVQQGSSHMCLTVRAHRWRVMKWN